MSYHVKANSVGARFSLSNKLKLSDRLGDRFLSIKVSIKVFFRATWKNCLVANLKAEKYSKSTRVALKFWPAVYKSNVRTVVASVKWRERESRSVTMSLTDGSRIRPQNQLTRSAVTRPARMQILSSLRQRVFERWKMAAESSTNTGS